MKTLKCIPIAICTILMSVSCIAAEELEIGGFKIAVGEPWKMLSDEVKEQTGFEAVWLNPKTKRPNAALLATELPKSVSKEADGMASSAKDQPEVIKLLEDRKVELKDGGEARIVSLEVRAGNQQLGIAAPMIFHSIYLPTKEGKSVTFKLQCAKTDLATLKPSFEAQVLKGRIPAPKIEGGARQPASDVDSKSKGKEKPKPESKRRSQ